MKIMESAENYLETILILSQKLENVKSIDIVNKLHYSKPSVSIAMKQLRENGFITVDDDGYIKLTDIGFEIADEIYQRHNLLADIFISIGVTPETAYMDACRIEHHMTQETFDKIKEYYTKHSELPTT